MTGYSSPGFCSVRSRRLIRNGAPEKIEDVLPVFPRDARESLRDQLVVLQALIDHEGVVRYLDVVTSVPELDAPAMAAARQWRFRPARRNGDAMPYVMTLTVGFVGHSR